MYDYFKVSPEGLVGKRLRDFRLMKGYTQNDVAHWLGKSQSYVNLYELGKAPVKISDVEIICSKFYGLEVENFTEGKPVDWSSVR